MPNLPQPSSPAKTAPTPGTGRHPRVWQLPAFGGTACITMTVHAATKHRGGGVTYGPISRRTASYDIESLAREIERVRASARVSGAFRIAIAGIPGAPHVEVGLRE